MKKTISLLFVFLLIFSLTTIAFANEDTDTTEETTNEEVVEISDTVKNAIEKTYEDDDDIYLDGGIKKVTLDEVTSKFERKGYEIVNFLQTTAQPFTIIAFIIGGLMVLVGSVGNHSLSGKGYFVMFFSAIVYVAILFSPEILNFAVVWWAS